MKWLAIGLLGAVAAIASPAAKADVIVADIPTFGGGNENISTTLTHLEVINPNIVYLGSYLDSSPGSVAVPIGETITGTGTGSSGIVTSNLGTIYYYAVKAGSNSDLIQIGTPAQKVNWSTNWANLLVGHGNIPDVSHIDVFGVTGSTVSVPEPASIMAFSAGLLALGMVFRRRRV